MSTNNNMPEKMELDSMDVSGEKRADLKQLFPSVFTETVNEKGELVESIDFEKLKAELGTFSDLFEARRERYGMDWPGKKEALKLIQQRSVATLKPCREESVNFETTENLFIEGDNLEVLKLLQKAYYGKVKMIYIDPPYNTGEQFIYPDDYSETLETYLAYAGLVDDEGKKFSTNTPNEGRFHTKWLNMMYPRMYLARNLLREDGVIFISIDDNEVSNLRKLCDDILGEQNFITGMVWNSEGHTDNQYDIKINHEYVLVYAKSSDDVSLGYVVDPNTRQESNLWKGFAENSITKNGPGNPPSEILLPIGFPVKTDTLDLDINSPSQGFYDRISEVGYITRQMTKEFKVIYPIRKDKMLAQNGRLTKPCRVFSGWANANKVRNFIQNGCNPIEEINEDSIEFYLSENGVVYYKRIRKKARNILSVLRNMGTTEQMSSSLEEMGLVYSYPKPIELISYLTNIGLEDETGIVLDFFAGSCTTAHAVLDLNKVDGNRKFIMVQLPEPCEESSEGLKAGYKTIADIGKERIRRVIKKIEEEQKTKQPELFDGKKEQLDLGFMVLKLDRSNFRIWEGSDPDASEEEIVRQLEIHIDHIDPTATQEDILFELLLKAGFMPTEKAEKLELAGKTVFSIAEGALLICLEDEITRELIDAVAETEPLQFICLDRGFKGNDQLKANAVQTFAARNQSREKGDQIVFRTV